jgi:hypothetical protein
MDHRRRLDSFQPRRDERRAVHLRELHQPRPGQRTEAKGAEVSEPTGAELEKRARAQLGRYIVAVARRLNRAEMDACWQESCGHEQIDEWSANVAKGLTDGWHVERLFRDFRAEEQAELKRENARLRSMHDALESALHEMRRALGYFEKFQAEKKAADK